MECFIDLRFADIYAFGQFKQNVKLFSTYNTN